MRIFVTGGTGFIGSHLIAKALDSGIAVTAQRRSIQSDTAIALPFQPDWINCDLLDIRSCDLNDCNAIVHLATTGVSPREVSLDELVRVNVGGTAHVVSIAHRSGTERIVVSGSSHEYGETAYRLNPIPASAPLEPLNLYGSSKTAAFHIARAYACANRLSLYYGRIFSVYGEGQFRNNFWPCLKTAALSGGDFLMSSGNQVRDFIRVEDVADKLLSSCLRNDISKGKVLVENIASGKSRTLLDFAQSEWSRLCAKGRLLPGRIRDRIDEAPSIIPELSPYEFGI